MTTINITTTTSKGRKEVGEDTSTVVAFLDWAVSTPR
jgi:hypothetical protein